MLFATAYLPPVSYVAAIAEGLTLSSDTVRPSAVTIDACEHYIKQTWRNRCRIASAAGVEDLRVPVVHEGGGKMIIGDVRVDYSTPWIVRTERALEAAYRSSAFFDAYADGLFAILESRPQRLLELNTALLRYLLSRLGIPAEISFTESYIPRGEAAGDYRDRIHPKRPDTLLEEMGLEKPYFQVFAQKYGFQSNLSCIDLLFNEGPDSISYLVRR